MADDKKYLIKHKWMLDGGMSYVHRNGRTGKYFLGGKNLYQLPGWSITFTKKQIEEIKKEFNTTLSDFEIIEVK